MKNYNKILILFISTIILTGCFNKDEKVPVNSDKSTANNIEAPVNKVYEKIADKQDGLKNATNEDLDKIIQEEIRMLNTPSSKYPFFEQLTTKKGNIQDIKNAGGLEVTRGNIYLHGLDSNVVFINDILSDNEKLFSFHQENIDNNFFYLDGSYDLFIKKIQSKFSDYQEISKQDNFIDFKFQYDKKHYSVQLILPSQTSRDELDNIFDAKEKIKVSINLLK